MPPGVGESMLGYHSCNMKVLTCTRESGGGHCQVDSLTGAVASKKVNGGVQRLVQHGRKSCNECKRINQPNCETDKSSSNEIGVSDPAV